METIKMTMWEGNSNQGCMMDWPLEKLVYLILMHGAEGNRECFEELTKQDTLGCLGSFYTYSWPKEELSYEKFVKYAKDFPASSDISFDESLYDYFSMPFQANKGPGPIVCHAKDKPELAYAILRIFKEYLKYNRFDYYCERDLYGCIIKESTFAKLKELPRKLRKEFENLQHKRIHPNLTEQLKDENLIGRQIWFACKRLGFKCPWTF